MSDWQATALQLTHEKHGHFAVFVFKDGRACASWYPGHGAKPVSVVSGAAPVPLDEVKRLCEQKIAELDWLASKP